MDGPMMTMAKTNGPSVFLQSHQAGDGGLFFGLWEDPTIISPPRPHSHSASESVR